MLAKSNPSLATKSLLFYLNLSVIQIVSSSFVLNIIFPKPLFRLQERHTFARFFRRNNRTLKTFVVTVCIRCPPDDFVFHFFLYFGFHKSPLIRFFNYNICNALFQLYYAYVSKIAFFNFVKSSSLAKLSS